MAGPCLNQREKEKLALGIQKSNCTQRVRSEVACADTQVSVCQGSGKLHATLHRWQAVHNSPMITRADNWRTFTTSWALIHNFFCWLASHGSSTSASSPSCRRMHSKAFYLTKSTQWWDSDPGLPDTKSICKASSEVSSYLGQVKLVLIGGWAPQDSPLGFSLQKPGYRCLIPPCSTAPFSKTCPTPWDYFSTDLWSALCSPNKWQRSPPCHITVVLVQCRCSKERDFWVTFGMYTKPHKASFSSLWARPQINVSNIGPILSSTLQYLTVWKAPPDLTTRTFQQCQAELH